VKGVVAEVEEIKSRAAYLRGLIEGSAIGRDEKEKMVWEGLLAFCEKIADAVTDLSGSSEEFGEYVEAIDEDLSVLEKYFYQVEDEDDVDIIFTNEAGDRDSTIEITCPNCHEELTFADSGGDYEVVCPECGKVIWNHYIEETVEPLEQRPAKDELN
jgi:DNA-directed RNA polymerase subunit delta